MGARSSVPVCRPLSCLPGSQVPPVSLATLPSSSPTADQTALPWPIFCPALSIFVTKRKHCARSPVPPSPSLSGSFFWNESAAAAELCRPLGGVCWVTSAPASPSVSFLSCVCAFSVLPANHICLIEMLPWSGRSRSVLPALSKLASAGECRRHFGLGLKISLFPSPPVLKFWPVPLVTPTVA